MEPSTIIAGIVAIATAYFQYNQYTKNKKTDFKIEQIKEEDKIKNEIRNRDVATIYGELWSLRSVLGADRVYIIQPHPDHNYNYLSVMFEVTKNGVSSIKDLMQNIPISSAIEFSKKLADECWIEYNNIDEGVEDRLIKAKLKLGGAEQIAIKQLVNAKNDWIGSLVVESTNETVFDPVIARKKMKSMAGTIQFILPSIR